MSTHLSVAIAVDNGNKETLKKRDIHLYKQKHNLFYCIIIINYFYLSTSGTALINERCQEHLRTSCNRLAFHDKKNPPCDDLSAPTLYLKSVVTLLDVKINVGLRFDYNTYVVLHF